MRKLVAVLALLVVSCFPPSTHYLTTKYGQHSFTDIFGIDHRTNGFWVNHGQLIDVEFNTISIWQDAMNASGVECDVPIALHDHVLVSWVHEPFYDESFPGVALAGLAQWEGPLVALKVGFEEYIALTALGHELGHAVLMKCGEPWDERSLAEWADRYGVPY